jgi:hypothetical protein
MKLRALFILVLFATMNPTLAGIRESLDDHKKMFGDVSEVSRYRPDLFPTSYIFKKAGVTITVTPLPEVVTKIDVFFESVPSESIETLLDRYSGVSGWTMRPSSDPLFMTQFPLFSTTDKRNSLYVAKDVTALVQRDVGSGKLVLWIQAIDYLDLLRDYQKKNGA